MNKERLFHYFYKWLGNLQNAHICDEKKMICFCNENYHAHVVFYQQLHTVELSIEDKQTNQNVFYLHFEVKDMLTSRNHILSFLQFLQGRGNDFRHQSILHLAPIKILISCSSGFTSSYFASLMQETFENQNIHVQIDAYSVLELEHVEKDYDVILLAPQVAYMYPSLKKKFGRKIMQIEAMDFATGNVNHTLETIFA